MYSFTVAIANALLVSNRADDALRMIDPLLDEVRDQFAAALPLLCVRARIALFHERRPERAIECLKASSYTSVVDFRTASEATSALWLGWAMIESEDVRHLPRAVYLLQKARDYFDRVHRTDLLCWTLLGLAKAFERLEDRTISLKYLEKAAPHVGSIQDIDALIEYRRLLDSDLDSSQLDKPNTSLFSAEIECEALRAAKSVSPILIVGEEGSGKATLAARIMALSELPESDWMRFDCKGNSPTLPVNTEDFERILRRKRAGIFFHHVGALPNTHQQSLARVLHEDTRVPWRLMASSNTDLEELVQQGRFDASLFYTLQVNTIEIPPLRNQPKQILPLTKRFVSAMAAGHAPMTAITETALNALCKYQWPGNVRQLRTETERMLAAISIEPLPVISSKTLPLEILSRSEKRLDASAGEVPLDDILAETERRVIEEVLVAHDGQVTATAGSLGLSRQGLYKKIKRLGIIVSRFHSGESESSATITHRS